MSDLKPIEANGTVSNGVVPEAALRDKEREPVNDAPSSPSDSDESQLPAKEKPISTVLTIIRHFDLIWFTISMDTGVLSILLHNLPYHFSGIGVLSTIMFVLNLVLWSLFSILFITRCVIFPKETRRHIFDDAEEIALLAAPTIGFQTLVAQVVLTCSESWGYRFMMLGYVLWWIGLVWIFADLVTLYIHLVVKPAANVIDDVLPTAVFVPIVGTMTEAVVGGLLVNKGRGITPTLAVPVIIVSFMLVGLAFLMAIVVYALYAHRLMRSGWPPPEKIPGMVLTIGPCGQAAAALLGLGVAADGKHGFTPYDQGFFLSARAAFVVRATCDLIALLLLGFAVLWIFVAHYAIARDVLKKRCHRNLSWWSAIFPNGTVITALISLSVEMHSRAFRILAAGFLIYLFLLYFMNVAFTMRLLIREGLRKFSSKSGTMWKKAFGVY